MNLRGQRTWVAGLCAVALMGAGATIAPAATALSTNWDRVWKQDLQPRADQRYYTKSQATKRFAPRPRVIRGVFLVHEVVAGDQFLLSTDISWGWDLGKAPTVHLISPGGNVPTGCSGTVAAPGADPGNLCIFEHTKSNVTSVTTCDATGSCDPSASPFGAGIAVQSTFGGPVELSGSWAVAPSGPLA